MLKLKKKIEQGMAELKLSRSGLSKAIGHSRNYLSECLRVGVCTEKQSEIIGKIDKLLKPKTISIGVSDKEDESLAYISLNYHNQEVGMLKSANAVLHGEIAHWKEKYDATEKNRLLASSLLDESNKDREKLMSDVKEWKSFAWLALIIFVVFTTVCAMVR